MKRLLAMAGALCLFLSLAGATFAQGYGPGTSPPSRNPGVSISTTTRGMVPSRATTFRTRLFYSPTHPAPIIPFGAVIVSQVFSGTATTVTYRFGFRDYHVTYYPNGSYTYVITRSLFAAPTVSPFAARTGLFYSPARPAPIVPFGAVVVSQVFSGTATTVTYRFGFRYYHVTYYPNGSYTYVITRSPFAVTAVAPPVVVTPRAPTYVAPRPVYLPPAGGGSAPGFPSLPFLVGLGLTGLGILLRKLAVAVR